MARRMNEDSDSFAETPPIPLGVLQSEAQIRPGTRGARKKKRALSWFTACAILPRVRRRRGATCVRPRRRASPVSVVPSEGLRTTFAQPHSFEQRPHALVARELPFAARLSGTSCSTSRYISP